MASPRPCARRPDRLRVVTDLRPDPRNANRGTTRGRQLLEDSLRSYGAGRAILADRYGHVIAGNKTAEIARRLQLPIRVIESDGRQLVVVRRTDLDVSRDPRAQQLALADNRVGELDLEWEANRRAEPDPRGCARAGRYAANRP
jgi:hypothetical protein